MPDVVVLQNSFQRGLSGAKNSGVAEATGQVVAFLDDDAVADPNWLKYLLANYDDPAVVGVGGLTLPNWESHRPPWFPREFDWTVGCTYVGMPECTAPVRNLLGGNASFRREVFALAGLFRTGIGRSLGKRPLGCEETEFCIRLRQRSPQAVLLFESRAIIHHLVPAGRCRLSYFASRCLAEGLSKAQVTACVGAADALASERTYVSHVLPRALARGAGDAIRGDLWGLGRAGAVTVGLAAAALGYIRGRVTARQPGPSAAYKGSYLERKAPMDKGTA
jgi:hypothetical protein